MLDTLSNYWDAETPQRHVLGFYRAMQPYHKALCQQWYYNIAVMRGNQWVMFQENSDVLRVPVAPSWRVRAVENLILPLAIIQRGKLIPNNPNISTRPSNLMSETDKNNSALAQKYLRAGWADNNFQAELAEMANWMVPCTMGYLLTLWDDKAGPKIADEIPPTPGILGIGADPGRPAIYMGDVVQSCPPPFEIVPDFTVSRYEDLPRFLRVKVRSLEYIEHRYGKKPKPMEIDSSEIFQLKAQSLINTGRKDIKEALKNHTLVYDMWELPTTKYPNGFHHTCTEDMDLIEPGTLDPYYLLQPNGSKKYYLPLDTAQMIRIAGMLIGTNCVEQATSAQLLYNQGNSTIMENIKRLGRTKVLAPENKIKKGAMVEDPAEVIVEYDSEVQGEIEFVKPPEMASYHLNFINRQPEAVMNAFGIHQASAGVLPRRATSGKAISFLIQQDDERHADPMGEIDDAVSSSFRKRLSLCAIGYTEERVADLMGDDGNIIHEKLEPKRLRAMDVTITRDIALPKEASARMELAVQILQEKPTTEQLDIMFAIMKARDMEDLEALLKGNSMAEEVYVKMENYDMAKGIHRPVAPGEKHTLHEKVHTEGLRNPGLLPAARQIYIAHIQQHQQQAGLEAAMVAQGQNAAMGPAQPAPAGEAQAPASAPAAQ